MLDILEEAARFKTLSANGQNYVESRHSGVIEQMNLLVAAGAVAHTLVAYEHTIKTLGLPHLSDKEKKKLLVAAWQGLNNMKKPGFMLKGLLYHVYLLYVDGFHWQIMGSKKIIDYVAANGIDLKSNFAGMLNFVFSLAGVFLDDQFTYSGYADVCSFLKLDSESLYNLMIS